MTKTEQLQKKLDELLAERERVKKEIEDAEKHIVDLKKRFDQLDGGWRAQGEIAQIKRAIEDSKFPVYDSRPHHWNKNEVIHRRILNVTPKLVILRYDGEEERRFSKETGCPPGSRWTHDKIDIPKALAIWEEHIKKGTA